MPMPMPAPFDGYVEVLARVSSTCLVTLQRNRYSVPCHLANQMAAVHLYANRIEIVCDNAVVANHSRLLDCDQISYNWQHYIPVIEKKPGGFTQRRAICRTTGTLDTTTNSTSAQRTPTS